MRLLVPLFLLSSVEFSCARNSSTDPMILNEVLNEYDRRIRPPSVNGTLEPVQIEVNSYIRSMSNINFVRMEFSLQLTFRQSWMDPRLAYSHLGDAADLPPYLILTQNDHIWIPDTFFGNEKHSSRHLIDTPNLLFRIHPNGEVLYSERLSFIFSCPMYLQKYPMDEQNCGFQLASYGYTTDEIVYKWKPENPIQFHSQLEGSLPCFSLIKYETNAYTTKTNTGEYSYLSVNFHLRRQFSYYLAQVYIPSTLLVIVSWISFWIERTAVPARVTLGVTTLLTITTQTASVNGSLPAVTYVKAVDIWMGGCLLFIFAAVIQYAFVSLVGADVDSKKKRQQNCEKHSDSCISPEMSKSMSVESENLLKENTHKMVPSFWRKWTMEADRSKMIDLRSRIWFPIMFVIFQVAYWTWYAHL